MEMKDILKFFETNIPNLTDIEIIKSGIGYYIRNQNNEYLKYDIS